MRDKRGGGHDHGQHDHGHREHDHREHDHGPDRQERGRERRPDSPVEKHKHAAPVSVEVTVITVSDTRRGADDTGGELCKTLLAEAGHKILAHEHVADDANAVRELVQRAAGQAVILTGGTGIGARDVTIEALEPLWEKRLPGFGELFRMLSADAIGAAAWLSRAAAGTVAGRLVFALPGSPHAVELAMVQLILPEIGHAAGLLAPPQGNKAD